MYTYKAIPFQTMWDKMIALLQSKRFVASVVAGLLVLFGPDFGLDEELATSLVTAIVAMVVGDSVLPISELLKSRRVWAFFGSVIAVVTSALEIGLPPEIVQQVVLIIAAWIVGDSWRVTLRKTVPGERILRD